jgi:hypothetical protein
MAMAVVAARNDARAIPIEVADRFDGELVGQLAVARQMLLADAGADDGHVARLL